MKKSAKVCNNMEYMIICEVAFLFFNHIYYSALFVAIMKSSTSIASSDIRRKNLTCSILALPMIIKPVVDHCTVTGKSSVQDFNVERVSIES